MADAAVAVDEAPARSAQLYIADMTADLEVLVGEVSDEYIKAMTEVIGKLTIDADISLEASSSEGVAGLMAGATLVLVIPVGVAAGGTWIAVNFGFRAITMGRQGLCLVLTANAVAKDVTREIQDRGETIRPQIVNEYKKHFTESMTELKTLIAAAETAAKASRAERADALTEIDTKCKSLQTTITAVETPLAKITAGAKPAELKK